MIQELELEFETDDTRAGFRLDRVEVLNWGTFHQKVWALTPQGQNVLVTGDIGSGKSTLIDAITTLLVPAHRIAYNKAAGANIKERSLRSYVQGYYKSERTQSGYGAKPVALRESNTYSVILGVFSNRGYNQTVTLAQVFWQTESGSQPSRFYLVADTALSITEHFSHFGSDLKKLKKDLKSHSDILGPFDSFPPYASEFRRRFGIENDQALELFHQTVSMKSVGNLTDFVRSHMLEPFDVAHRIQALIDHFDNLTHAHNAVLKARDQIQRLSPISEDIDKHAKAEQDNAQWRFCRNGLEYYFTDIKTDLLKDRLSKLTVNCEKYLARIEKLTHQRTDQQAERDRIKQAIAENGGDRLERIKTDIQNHTRIKEQRFQKSSQYSDYCKELDLPLAETIDQFLENREQAAQKLSYCTNDEITAQNERTEKEVAMRSLRDEHETLNGEIESLQHRRSNIDTKQISIRKKMCAALQVTEEDLPFAGELLQVRDEERLWEGAMERLLRNFALSLLVPDRLYPAVSNWVDQTNLRGRIVYFRIGTRTPTIRTTLHPDSLVRKIAIKADSECYPWLEAQLHNRFNYACCTDLETFRREKLAITVQGQIKGAGNRHEKDDRHVLTDRSRYVLGWNNEAKKAALIEQRTVVEKHIQELATQISDLQQRVQYLNEQKALLIRLDSFTRFEELNWQEVSQQIVKLDEERVRLEETSDILKTLNGELEYTDQSIAEIESKLDAQKSLLARDTDRKELTGNALSEAEGTLSALEPEYRQSLNRHLEPIRQEVLGKTQITLESADKREREIREFLQTRIDAVEKRIKSIAERLVRRMQDYCRDYPAETIEVDAAIESGGEFKEMLKELQKDDLPRFEKKFKELLNENTIREIANFQSQLNRERQEIKERIDLINQSLADIEYNPGRYIQLEAQTSQDNDIRDFQIDLRKCTEGSLTGSTGDQYAESKFLEVKKIIDRFRGREGSSDLDKKWTLKVTDVRNWYSFAASEKWLEDNSEHEHYTDSGGKSGGQKEKLAYTVLAASLAYQFGLEWGEVRSRSFRFVAIDEAFGRGSDESARFGLELFKKLNLQLLIVTPLQKIHIIEPYVSSVGFVHSPGGKEAQLRNLTIEEYREEKGKAEDTAG